MEASLFGSIFFIVAFAVLFLSVFQYKKSDDALNGVSWLIITFVTILCYGALTAGIIRIINIPINIVSVGIIYFVTGVALIFHTKKINEKQVYKWEVYDFIWAGLLFVIMFLLGGYYFGSEINLTYANSDAGVHFKNAMEVVRHQKIANVYFAPLLTAMVIETVMPVVAEVNFYKVFILTDVSMLMLEIAFFMVVVRDFVKTKAMKVIGFAAAIIYLLGYPLNSFLFSFYYWGMGVMIIAYLLLMLRYYENKVIDRKLSVIGLMLGCAALPITYMIFGPIMYIATFIMLAIIKFREGKLITLENILLALKVFLVPTCIAIYYCLFSFLIPTNLTVTGVLNIKGGVYEDLYINFVWTLPFVVYMIIKTIRERKINETLVSLIVFGGVTLTMFVLIITGHFASYYFYKLYYPLWLFFFVLTVQAIEDLWDKSKDILISLFAVFVFMAFMFVGNVEARVAYPGSALNSGWGYTDKAGTALNIWTYNKGLWNSRSLKYPQEYLDICNYVIEDLKNEEKVVPLLATQENYSACYWYEAITGEPCGDYYGWFYSFDEVKAKIEAGEINYFVVYKDSPIYFANLEYFGEFEYVYENDLGFVAKVK